MRIVWDEPKRLANLDKHRGLDFADLTPEFFLSAVIVPVKMGRFMAVGRLDGKALAVVFARLGTEGISVISMRVANEKERARL